MISKTSTPGGNRRGQLGRAALRGLAEEERDQQQCKRVYNARDGRSAAVPDVGRGACNRPGRRNAAKDAARDVRHTLRDQLHVGPVTSPDHPVGDHRGKQ